MKLLGRDVFGRGLIVENKVCEDKWTIGEISIFELVEAFRKTISGMVKKELMEIDTERISLSDRINEIISRLGESEVLTFADLLRGSGDKTGIVYTFLAILELVKLRIVRAYQAIPHGPIRICLSVESK
jgi:segregation and condensation protein A